VVVNPLSQYLMIGKLVALLGCIALICWQSSQIHKWHVHSDLLNAQLQATTTAKDNQKVITRDRIKVVTKTVHDADQRAKVVENAPAAPACKTKPEVLQADL